MIKKTSSNQSCGRDREKNGAFLKSLSIISKSSSVCTKSVCAISNRPFGEGGGQLPLQLSSQTHFKIEDKKVIAKN